MPNMMTVIDRNDPRVLELCRIKTIPPGTETDADRRSFQTILNDPDRTKIFPIAATWLSDGYVEEMKARALAATTAAPAGPSVAEPAPITTIAAPAPKAARGRSKKKVADKVEARLTTKRTQKAEKKAEKKAKTSAETPRTEDSINDDKAMLALNERNWTRVVRLKLNHTDPLWRPDGGDTDAGNGERFEAMLREQLIFTKTRGWLFFDTRRWTGGEEYAQRAAVDVAKSIRAEANIPGLAPDDRLRIVKHARESLSDRSIGSMLHRAETTPDIWFKEENLDNDPFLLNTQNVTIDLRTGEAHTHNPGDYITRITACDFNLNATSKLWEAFLEEATRGEEGLAEFLQRAVGYTLTGDIREDRVFVLHGPGGTGKSTFIGAIRKMMGDYARTMRAETLTEKGGGGHNEDVAVLAGARMVLAVEADEQSRMREGLLKHLSGGDEMSASRKNKPVFLFAPQLKFWLATNHIPKVRSDDTGTWRRVTKITFTHIPASVDPTLRAKLREPEHQRAILAWAVRGAMAWWKDAERGIPLRIPESVIEATEEMRRSVDGWGGFAAEWLTFMPGETQARTLHGEVMDAYWQYCDEVKIERDYRLGTQAIASKLRDSGATPTRLKLGGKVQRGYTGLLVNKEPSI